MTISNEIVDAGAQMSGSPALTRDQDQLGHSLGYAPLSKGANVSGKAAHRAHYQSFPFLVSNDGEEGDNEAEEEAYSTEFETNSQDVTERSKGGTESSLNREKETLKSRIGMP
jgi:hypothetical protein